MRDPLLRVMSFNVRGAFHDAATRNAWRHRAGLNVATLERYAPDLVGLQEAQRPNLGAYRRRLPRYEHIPGPEYGNIIPHDYNTILYDPRHLEPLDSGGFWLSESPERHSKSWDTRVARSATWVLFRVAGLTLLHLNTHLDHVSALARREGSRLIIGKVAQICDRADEDPAVILTGDFNTRPGTAAYTNFIEAGFTDTFLAAGNEDAADANTFHAFKGTAYRDAHPGRGPRRIDWILLRDPQKRLQTRSQDIVRDTAESTGLYPSDHYPVMTAFQLVS